MAILLSFRHVFDMTNQQMYSEPELAALANKFREKSDKTKVQLAREIEITRATMQDVEERPERNLTKLRLRIIENTPVLCGRPGQFIENEISPADLE